MKVKRLKEILNELDDDLEIFIRNSVNACGNISELEQVEKSTYGFLGSSIDCIILNTECAKREIINDEGELTTDFDNGLEDNLC